MTFRIMLFCFIFTPLFAQAADPVTQIDNRQLQALQATGIPVYDIRREEEWKQTGIIKGSHKLTFVDDKGNLAPGFVKQFTQAISKNDPVILICRTGHRTGVLSSALAGQLGYTKIYNVKNGITSWISEGLPVDLN